MEQLKREDFPRVLEIMEEAFPESERRTALRQEALLDLPHYKIYVHRDEAGGIDCFLAVWVLSNCVFGEHLASVPSTRGKGVGSSLLKAVLDGLDVPFFLEVEPPCDELSKRRVAMYERMGFFLNEFYYEQQPLRDGHQAQRLMVMSYGSPVDEAEFICYKREIYRHVYGVEL
ncbi:MAG TPA: GNAT family N-acetyltransferase [Candidatus Acidoferrum sp.]|nr:GNAT family N-acetyltransferase [Candidatus Acidoferrum sp.]